MLGQESKQTRINGGSELCLDRLKKGVSLTSAMAPHTMCSHPATSNWTFFLFPGIGRSQGLAECDFTRSCLVHQSLPLGSSQTSARVAPMFAPASKPPGALVPLPSLPRSAVVCNTPFIRHAILLQAQRLGSTWKADRRCCRRLVHELRGPRILT